MLLTTVVFGQQVGISDMLHCPDVAEDKHFIVCKTPFLSTRDALALSYPETVQ